MPTASRTGRAQKKQNKFKRKAYEAEIVRAQLELVARRSPSAPVMDSVTG